MPSTEGWRKRLSTRGDKYVADGERETGWRNEDTRGSLVAESPAVDGLLRRNALDLLDLVIRSSSSRITRFNRSRALQSIV